MAQPEPPFRRLARTPTLWILGAVLVFFGVGAALATGGDVLTT